ncbi:LacI family DNA-binding transcriptional regulator [Streptococcus pluranimalium]|uniref:LacI family DNA-binding transcriptional regulator n=1 Tax=Streptococcus pluranimalium TaxID=82348 RepID=UPI0039FD0E2D
MVTIKDVAERAGVNPSTVSRVLKDNRSISQKTKDKVRKAMTDLGYVPNVAAQMLASGLSHAVGLVFPPLATSDRLSEPFFMRILSTITHQAKLNDFTISIATGTSLEDLLAQVSLMHQQKRVDGFIILYSDQEDPIRHYLLDNKIPFVVLGAPEGKESQITYINNDNQLMGKKAVSYLYDKGHRAIAFVTDDQKSKVTKERFNGYKEAMIHYKLPHQSMLLFDPSDPKTVDELMTAIEDAKPTALVVISDRVTIRLMQLLSYYGLKVPDHISLITFNNSIFSTLIHPYLTTFDIHLDQLGETSFKQLLRMIKSKPYEEDNPIIVPFTLKERESVRNMTKK